MSSLVSGTSFTGRGAGGPSIDQVIATRIGGEIAAFQLVAPEMRVEQICARSSPSAASGRADQLRLPRNALARRSVDAIFERDCETQRISPPMRVAITWSIDGPRRRAR